MSNNFKKQLLITVFSGCTFIILCWLTPISGYIGDLEYFSLWSKLIQSEGLSNAYKTDNNYMPLFQYLLLLFNKLKLNTSDFNEFTLHFKRFILFFYCLSAIIFFAILSFKKVKLINQLLLIFVFVLFFPLLYNTLIWGQVDVLYVTFLLMALYYYLKDKLFFMLLFFMIALNLKLQSIVFLPLIILLFLHKINIEKSKHSIIKAILFCAALQFSFILPFITEGTLKRMCINLYFGNIDGTAYISMNAFNFWHLIFSGELWNKSDQLSIGFLNYKQTGLLLFFTSSFMALYPLIKIVYQKFILKTIPALLSANAILIMASLIYFLFFFFNTQMHERYSHAGVFFLVVYALLNSKWVLLILGGGAYFLNLEAVLRFFNLNYLAFCFTPKFIASLFLLIIMTLFVKLYTEVSVKKSCNSF